MAEPAFDPDKYLSEKTAAAPTQQGFDPDKYLAEKTGGPSQAQTFGEHAANQATLGYLPQLQAAASKPIYGALNAITGKNVQPDSYVDERDRNIARLQEEQRVNPKTALAGDVTGAVGGAAITPGPGAAKGLMGAVSKGALYGAEVGAAGNPGDVKGEINPTQIPERIKNAESGALTGAVTGGVTQGASKGFQALANSGEKAGDIASTQAVRGAGAMLKDFRAMNGRKQTQDIGNFMLDKGLIKAGDTVDDVAAKSTAFNKEAGERLSGIYDQAKTEALSNLSEEQLNKVNAAGFNPAMQKDEILSAVKDKMGNGVKKDSAVNAVSNYMDQLTRDLGDRALTPKEAQEIKTSLDQEINYSRNPLTKDPAAEKGYSAARQYISKKIDDGISALGEATGKPGLLQELKEANRDYGYSAQVKNLSTDRTARDSANRMMSLTDTIATGSGAAAGGALGAAFGGDTRHGIGEAALGGAAAGLLNHGARKYGPGMLAGGARAAQPILESTAVPVGQLGSQADQGLLMRAGTLLRRKNSDNQK